VKLKAAHRDVLVLARKNAGRYPLVGPGSKEAWDLERADYMVDAGGHYELNLRGQDAADVEIEKAKGLAHGKT
jgi:hypothetical protein